MTNEELTRIYHEANGIVGKNPPITTERIFTAMRAAYAAAHMPSKAARREQLAEAFTSGRVTVVWKQP